MPSGTSKVTRTCAECYREFEIYRAWLRNGNAGIFCSAPCAALGRRRRPKTMLSALCQECGVTYVFRKGGRVQGTKFCSRECKSTSNSRTRAGAPINHRILSGPDHPNWKGGISAIGRKSSTVKVTQEAVRRVAKCERCGGVDRLQGHHKKSHAKFPNLRDDPRNIEVLCVSCHAAEHPAQAALMTGVSFRTGIVKVCLRCGTAFYSKASRQFTAKFCSGRCQRSTLHENMRVRNAAINANPGKY